MTNSLLKTYTFPQSFDLELGGLIQELTLCYQTYGRLNEKRDNVIWVCHALTANAEVDQWWSGLYGPGNLFDPEKYFIVCVNNLGSPYGTTSPNVQNPETGNRYGMDFPDFTLRDTARSIILLMEHLNLNAINLLIGGSCGGNIALEISILKQAFIKNLVLLCCSAQESPWSIAIHHSQRIALEADPDFQKNAPFSAAKGIKAARAFALPLYRTPTSMNKRQEEQDSNKVKDFRAASYINYQGDKFAKRFDAHCYYKLLCALDTHNLARGRNSVENALSQIEANTLVIGIDSDIFIPVVEQKKLAHYIPNARYAEINSIFGHDAFLIETEQIQAFVKTIVAKEGMDQLPYL